MCILHTNFKCISYLSFLVSLLIILTPSPCWSGNTKQTPALAPHEMYKDIFPLSASNFTQTVLEDILPWIVLPHRGSLDLSWKKTAVQLRGMVRFGMIDSNEEATLLESLNLKDSTAARVYPYGSKHVKEKYIKDVGSPLQAVREAEESFPCYLQNLDNTPFLSHFLTESIVTSPSRFPVIFFTKEVNCGSIPLLFRSIALRLHKLFNFRLLVNPREKDLRMVGLDVSRYYAVPGVIVIMMESPDEGLNLKDMKSYAVQFDSSKELNYTNLLHFFLNINAQLRHKLPGDNQSHVKEVMTAQEVLEAERGPFDVRTTYPESPVPVTTPTPPDTQIPDPYMGQGRPPRDEF